MKRRWLYIIVSTYLLFVGIVNILRFIPAVITAILNNPSLGFTVVYFRFLVIFLFPHVTSPMLLLSGGYYLWKVYKRQPVNGVIFASAMVQFISIFLFLAGVILGTIPCVSGPPDGLCMLFGIPFIFLTMGLWIAGFIVFIVGVMRNWRKGGAPIDTSAIN